MNRFEAMHALGLEEGCTDEDVKVAFYGLEQAADLFDFSDVEQLKRRVEKNLDTARESKKYLLNPHNKSAARQATTPQSAMQDKLTVTAEQSKLYILKGVEHLRLVVCSYLGSQQERRRNSIILLLACILFGFFALRYIRLMMARIATFTVLAIIAVAGSTILTQSIIACRKLNVHVMSIDGFIEDLREELGLKAKGSNPDEPDPKALFAIEDEPVLEPGEEDEQ